MFTGWLSFAGVEIVNEARLTAYASALGVTGSLLDVCEECPTLRTALEHDPYTTPEGDLAPWFDTGIPESGQVAGFQIASISGLGDTATRHVDELSRDGAVVGARRRASRELAITFRAVASTECALNYAAAWLSKVLRGSDCLRVSSVFQGLVSVACGSEQLCMLSCCPLTPEDVTTYQVSLYKVGVTQGPVVVNHQAHIEPGDSCGLALCEMEVTFTAGDPGWYSPAVNIVDTDLLPHYVGTTTPANPYNIMHLCNPLETDPYAIRCSNVAPAGCATTSVPTTASLPIPCIGIPDPRITYTQFNYYSIPISTAGITQWMDLVPMLTYQPGIMSGSSGNPDPENIDYYEGPIGFQIRRVTPGNPCGVQADDCEPCIELFAPTWSRWTPGVADWVNRKAFRLQSQCAFPVYTRGLGPFNWPTLICGDDICLDVYISTDSDARSGHLSLDVMRREDAQC